jgi:two-component system, chemotaxis family, chemotaxis protein CheY
MDFGRSLRLKTGGEMPDIPDIDPNLKFLVVDDLPTMREVIKSILRSLGCKEVTEAGDGTQAWEIIRHQKIDFVICDWMMPTMSGYDLLLQIKKEPDLKNIPFLMVTSQGERTKIVDAVRAGVSNYILKPFEAEELELKIRSVLQRVKR